MKYVLVFMLSLAALGLRAQDQRALIVQETQAQMALYQLDENQAQQMLRIQERRFGNLAEIESLRAGNYPLYLQKRRAIRTNTDGSIRRILRPDQMEIYNQQMTQRRLADSEFIKSKLQEGKTKEEIELLLLERD
jgi:hypothetical protein